VISIGSLPHPALRSFIVLVANAGLTPAPAPHLHDFRYAFLVYRAEALVGPGMHDLRLQKRKRGVEAVLSFFSPVRSLAPTLEHRMPATTDLVSERREGREVSPPTENY
jgi:hypothetical protein